MSKLDVDKMKDPFVWLKPVGDCDAEEKPFGFTNPLRACYEEIAPPLVEKPKAPRTPLAPIRTTTWDPGQGMKGARYPTFVPLPLPGTTPVTSATARVPRGESGKNTMVNLIVDVSGSMGATAATWRGYSFARWEVARICAAIMLKQCQIGDDAFAIYEFESHPHVLWKGPSYAHSDAIDYITSYDYGGTGATQGRSFGYLPFYPRGGTNVASGLRECIKGMLGQGIDKAVTIVISDIVDSSGDFFFNQAMASSMIDGKSCDEVLRSFGPTFYISIGDMGSKTMGDAGMKGFSEQLNNFYGKKITPAPGLFEGIDSNSNASTVSLGGGLAKMAQMTK